MTARRVTPPAKLLAEAIVSETGLPVWAEYPGDGHDDDEAVPALTLCVGREDENGRYAARIYPFDAEGYPADGRTFVALDDLNNDDPDDGSHDSPTIRATSLVEVVAALHKLLKGRPVVADPFTARQCPTCSTWVYVDAGPFAEGDRTKPLADWLHWEDEHSDVESRKDRLGFPYFPYNAEPVAAAWEGRQ